MTKKLWQPCGTVEFGQGDVDWGKLEAAGDLTLSDEHRRRLLQAMNAYRALINAENAGVRPGAVRRILKALADALEEADRALSLRVPARDEEEARMAITDKGRARMAARARKAPDEGRARMAAFREVQKVAALKYQAYAGNSTREGLRGEIRSWAIYAREAIGSLPADKGREGDSYIGEFLVTVHSIYASAGGKGAYTKPAEEFRAAVCGVVGYPVFSASALRKTYERALGHKSTKSADLSPNKSSAN